MTLQCVTITPILPAFQCFELRCEQSTCYPFNPEWILYLFDDLSCYVHNCALLIGVEHGNPPCGIPDMSADITVHPICPAARLTADFNTIILCERPV